MAESRISNSDVVPAYRHDSIDVICKLDRITAAVNMAHSVLLHTCSSGPIDIDRQALADAWLTLELVQEKLGDLRKEMEDA